jgi:hypothetical protein
VNAGDPTNPYASFNIVHIVDLDQSRNRNKVSAPVRSQTEVTEDSYTPASEYWNGVRKPLCKHFTVTEDDEIFRQALRPDAYYTHTFMVDISKWSGSHVTMGECYCSLLDGLKAQMNGFEGSGDYSHYFEMVMIDDEHSEQELLLYKADFIDQMRHFSCDPS